MARNTDGTFKQGHGGGRPKGAKNKASKPLRDLLTDFAESRFHQFVEDFDTLPPEKKVRAYADLLTFILPKLKPVDSKLMEDKPVPHITLVPVSPDQKVRPPIEWVK